MLNFPPLITNGKLTLVDDLFVEKSQSFAYLRSHENDENNISISASLRSLLTVCGCGWGMEPDYNGQLLAILVLMMRIKHNESVFVDIGADTGEITRAYASVMKNFGLLDQHSCLCMIELNTNSCDLLTRQFTAYGPQFKVLNKAVGEDGQAVDIYNAASSDRGIHTKIKSSVGVNSDQVLTESFLSIFRKNLFMYGLPYVVRVQVNGDEYNVIRSMGKLLDHVKILSFTIARFCFTHGSFSKIRKLLHSHDFIILRLTLNGFLVLRDYQKNSSYIDDDLPFTTNYIAIKKYEFNKYILPSSNKALDHKWIDALNTYLESC